MKFFSVGAIALALGIFNAGHAHAANLLTNGSFEAGTYSFGGDGGQDLASGSTTITGWTVVTNHVAPITTPNSFSVTAQDGDVSLDLQGYADGSPYGGVQQLLATIPGQDYELSFYIGVQNSVSIATGPASVTASAGSTSQDFTNTIATAGQQWQQFTLPFTATGASTIITLSGLSTTGGSYIGLENVVVTAVPEPASLSLVGVSAIAMLTRRRRSD
jgi:hypothetical protein